MQEVNQEHTSSRRNNRICYIILAVVSTFIVIIATMGIIGWVRWRDLEINPLVLPLNPEDNNDVSQNDGGRLLNSDEVGPHLLLNITNKIVNGDDVDLYEYPWFVQLEDPSGPGGRCSASLIAPEVSKEIVFHFVFNDESTDFLFFCTSMS